MEGKKTGKLSVKSYNYCLSYNFLRFPAKHIWNVLVPL